MSFRFTILIKKENKFYVAECLELGVVSQGKSIEEAKSNLKEAVKLYLEDQPKSVLEKPLVKPILSVMEIKYGKTGDFRQRCN